jgi:hypothetical protein
MLNSDYKEMLLLLQKYDVEFMLIGAYALAYHGVPRSTGDIDFFINCTPENSQKVYRALVEFGAPVSEIDELYLAQYGNMFQIGVAPCRIDLITQIDGVLYSNANKVDVEIEGIVIPVISKSDFIKNKRAAGRHKDLADIESLESGS